ncbi:MAG: peptide chain release factor 1 [Pseudomonadota bacterium]
MIALDAVRQIVQRFDFIEAQLASGSGDVVALGRDHAELRPAAEQARAYLDLLTAMAEARALAQDPEMAELAREELTALQAALPEAERAMRLALIPRDAADARPAILEIRPGTGGAEAALFAGDLLRMYQRYAERRGWRLEILEESAAEGGGIKELVAEVKGDGVFARLKRESGVHRVQRVPATESQGRIHTSAATVAVLPEAQEVDVEIAAADIRIDTMRASGAGGQHVNTTDSAVRLTHLPTGLVVTASEKSQHQNRARAMEVLRARLYDRQRQAAEAERAADRRGQVGSGDRSERIRTYNFPQGRVTDHRIGLTLYKLGDVMDGDLDEIVDALTEAAQAAALAEMEA